MLSVLSPYLSFRDNAMMQLLRRSAEVRGAHRPVRPDRMVNIGPTERESPKAAA